MYKVPSSREPIRQGDIFRWLPKVELPYGPANLPLLYDPDGREIDWLVEVAPNEQISTATATVRTALGIVISQDCDASRCMNVVFAEIKPFIKIFPSFSESPTPRAVIDVVTTHSRKNQKWYFLAENVDLQFDKKMGVDFESIFEVRREMLEKYKEPMRIGRLDDDVAWPHFRERVAEFFRRYPYNEWYPLNSEEAKHYEENKRRGNQDFVLDPRYSWQK